MTGPRVIWLDIARSLALLGMIVFHFCFDLAMFGLIPGEAVSTGFLRGLAVVVAASFIALAGVSLQLAHKEAIRWRPFLRRQAILVAAAALISLLTYIWVPSSFIFFGILHAIALFSLLGLAFLKVPFPVTLALAVAIYLAPGYIALPVFDHPLLQWVGLGTTLPRTLDYEPLFPWSAAFLAGMAFAQATATTAIMTPKTPDGVRAALSWPGRHSLWIYLAHQPILVAAVWLFVQLGGG